MGTAMRIGSINSGSSVQKTLAIEWRLTSPDDVLEQVEHSLDILEKLAEFPVFVSVPRFPPVLIDISLVVPDDLPCQKVIDAIWEFNQAQAGGLIKHVSVFDVYTGPPVKPRHRSISFALEYRSEQKTLTEPYVCTINEKLIKVLESTLGIGIRI